MSVVLRWTFLPLATMLNVSEIGLMTKGKNHAHKPKLELAGGGRIAGDQRGLRH
jgi:hypothetical protein